MLYWSWDMVHDRCNYFSFWPIFCPFTSLTTQKIKIKKKKMKKTTGDISFYTSVPKIMMCTKNHDHMQYCSWDMVCDRCNCYFSFWAIFCPFTSLTAQKIKIKKKHLEISFYNSVPKIMIICYTVPETLCLMDVIIFYFGPFFALLQNSPKNQNLKKWKKHLEISSFT